MLERLTMRAPAILLTAMLILPSLAVSAQTAEVTFYSNGSKLSPNAPHVNHAVFDGWLFDGNRPIGFVQPNHAEKPSAD